MANNANRVNNPMKVITGPDTRWSYANVWEPKSINGGAEKYCQYGGKVVCTSVLQVLCFISD